MFLKSYFSDTVSKIFPFIQKIPVQLSLYQVQSLLAKSLQSSPLASLSSLQSSLLRIDWTLALKFPSLECLYASCSGGLLQPPAVALPSRFKYISSRISSISVGNSSPLGSSPIPPPPSVFSTRLHYLEATVVQLSADLKNLQVCNGNNVVEIGDVMFESVHQTTTWVVTHLPSTEYFTFNDEINPLMLLVGFISRTDTFRKRNITPRVVNLITRLRLKYLLLSVTNF